MCGIAGFIALDDRSTEVERTMIVEAMCDAIRHRGPDHRGVFVKGRAAVGMQRLAIIDVAHGQQPIFSEDGRFAIVFNGEIYNYREIRKELEAKGRRFSTNSDTETILNTYLEFGEKCVLKLRGMFAFAILDTKDDSLYIARDRVGKKPLFFATASDGAFVFASEIKSILEYPDIDSSIDFSALDAYVTFGYVPEDYCIFRSIRKLMPGHFLTYKYHKQSTTKYWDFSYNDRDIRSARTEHELALQVREQVREAVSVRLMSEVPLGAFLSGGVDSSTIVAMMAELSDRPVKTFSIGFNEASYNELPYARLVAERFATEHHEFIVTPDLSEMVDDIAWHFDEPFADSSALPTYLVSKLAREHVTVVLSGDGGDEIFGGYSRYATNRRLGFFSYMPGLLRSVSRVLSERLSDRARGKNFLYHISLDRVGQYIDLVSHSNLPKRKKLYSDSMVRELSGYEESPEQYLRSFANTLHGSDHLSRLLYIDSKSYLPSDILTKVDRMTMAHSLEARAPLLDHKLIEFVSGIPGHMKMKASELKYIFKSSMEGILPDSILHRKKQGFAVPIDEWINDKLNDRITDTVLNNWAIREGLFRRDYIENLLSEHRVRRRDHSYFLWLIFMLELWHSKYFRN